MTRESRRRGEGRCWVDKPQPGLATLLVVSGKRDAEQECRQTVYAKATPWSCPPTPPPPLLAPPLLPAPATRPPNCHGYDRRTTPPLRPSHHGNALTPPPPHG